MPEDFINIKLSRKFSERHIDDFVRQIYSTYNVNQRLHYTFDVTQTEWISNQGLLLLSSVLKSFYKENIPFNVVFMEPGKEISQISKRTLTQILQLWEIWEVWSIVEEKDYSAFFDLDHNRIKSIKEYLKNNYRINTDNTKALYDRYGITPFQILNNIENYKDDLVIKELDPIFDLNQVIERKLYEANCLHPFVNNTLSSIITKELYENFLDHHSRSFFGNKSSFGFMSMALREKLHRKNPKIVESNILQEELPEYTSFFLKDGKFLNRSLIQYSFLDFGKGIVGSLKKEYLDRNLSYSNDEEVSDNEILEFAFKYDSSRHPIQSHLEDEKFFIPRGLFDLLTIVKRYKGLMIVRSNNGRIIYNFSSPEEYQDPLIKSNKSKISFFPGTFITIYIPEITDSKQYDSSVIKPIRSFNEKSKTDERYVNLIDFERFSNHSKEKIYNDLIFFLRDKLKSEYEKNFVTYFSFLGCSDERIIKKTLYFLLTDYIISTANSVIVVHPPSKEIVTSVKNEILDLNSTIKNFKIHPLPLIDIDNSNMNIDWVGIYNEEDVNQLSDYIYNEDLTKPITDFNDPNNLYGNLFHIDDYGNLKSQLPKNELIEIYYEKIKTVENGIVHQLIKRFNCIKKDRLFFCNGNYYQREFIQLINLLNNIPACNLVSKLLMDLLKNNLLTNIESNYFVTVTSSSHKILKSLLDSGFVKEQQCIFVENYHNIDLELIKYSDATKKDFVLLTDVYSSGGLTKRIKKSLERNSCKLLGVGALIDTSIRKVENLDTVSLYHLPVEKIKRDDLNKKDDLENIIRINPYTNIPIELTRDKSFYTNVIFKSEEFIDFLDEEDISMNFKIFNKSLHPYFFNLDKIFQAQNEKLENESVSFLEILFHKTKLAQPNTVFFYPKNSDINYLDYNLIKSKIFKNHEIDFFELEKFSFEEGFVFPHTTNELSVKINGKNVIILEDGSNSGDSVIQMINEIAIYDPLEINIISVIGKINDHKLEFFSKISSIKSNSGEGIDKVNVPVNIFFGSHWHVSYPKLQDSPNNFEIDWIKYLVDIKNLPLSIKNIGTSILNEIVPQEFYNNDYKYIPKTKETVIPKKELILVRNEIGKIIGHRFYKESFNWFNKFISKYENDNNTRDRMKEIELLSMCLLYEPYLYARLSKILPDVKEKLEEFVDSLIFGNPKRGMKKIDINKHLYFNWSDRKKDILHLFFIVFNDEALIKKLTKENFIELVNFSKDSFKKINPINYIFYKLLVYFPLKEDEVNKKPYSDELRKIIKSIADDENVLDISSRNELYRFYSFLNTLPSKLSYSDQLEKIRSFFWENKRPKRHEDRKSFNHNITRIIQNLKILKLYTEQNKDEEIGPIKMNIRSAWYEIKNDYLDLLVSFYRSYSGFFKPNPYNSTLIKLERKSYSLVELYSYVDEYIFNIEQKITDSKSYAKIIEVVAALQTNFGLESDFKDLFENCELHSEEFIQEFINELNAVSSKVVINLSPNLHKLVIRVPVLYLKKLIIKEVIDNLHAYSDLNSILKVDVTNGDEGNILINIENVISNNVNEFSSNEGLNCINEISEFTSFNIEYVKEINREENKFLQKFVIKR